MTWVPGRDQARPRPAGSVLPVIAGRVALDGGQVLQPPPSQGLQTLHRAPGDTQFSLTAPSHQHHRLQTQEWFVGRAARAAEP